MTTTGGTLVTAALRRLGVVSAVATPEAEDMALGLSSLNGIVDSLQLDPLSMFTLTRTVKTLASGTASYTIGTGGSINIPRPSVIEQVGLITNTADATPSEIARAVFSDDEWARIVQKTLTGGYIDGIYYDHGFAAGLGTVYPWPIPNTSTTQLVLYTRTPVSEFDQSTTVYLPAGYTRMFEYALAVELADPFEKKVSQRTERVAIHLLSKIKGASVRPVTLKMPAGMPGVRRGRGDIRTGV